MMLLPGGPMPENADTVLGTRLSAQMERAYEDIQRYHQGKARSLDGYTLPSGLTLVHAIQGIAHALESGDYLDGDPTAQQDLREAMEALLKPLRYDEELWREKHLLHLDESMLPANRRRRRNEHHAYKQGKRGKGAKKKELSQYLTNQEARHLVVLLFLLKGPQEEEDAYEGGVSREGSIPRNSEEDDVNDGRVLSSSVEET